MAEKFEKIYNKPYSEGYFNRPILTTPITAEIKNNEDKAIEHIEDYLANLEIPTDISQLTDIGNLLPSNQEEQYLIAGMIGDSFLPTEGGVIDLTYLDDKINTKREDFNVGGGLQLNNDSATGVKVLSVNGKDFITVSPKYTSGQEIAQISINDVITSLFAPDNDNVPIWIGTTQEFLDNFDSIEDGTILYITDELNTIQRVIPNPTGVPRENLNTILIDGEIYKIDGGGESSYPPNMGDQNIYEEQTEIEVGKYLGKRIYRYTYTFPAGSGGWSSNGATLGNIPGLNYSNIDRVINSSAVIRVPDGNTDAYGNISLHPDLSLLNRGAENAYFKIYMYTYYTSQSFRTFTWSIDYTKIDDSI